MKISKVLDAIRPFAAVAAQFIPGGPAILAGLNLILPPDKQLPANATGQQILTAVDTLPPDQRASFLEKEIDLKIAQEVGWTERYVAMTAADGQSTRPQIALLLTKMLVWQTIAFMALLGFAVIMKDGDLSVLSQPYLWTVFLTLTGVPSAVLTNYFGELRKEQQNRTGTPTAPGAIAQIIKAVSGK